MAIERHVVTHRLDLNLKSLGFVCDGMLGGLAFAFHNDSREP